MAAHIVNHTERVGFSGPGSSEKTFCDLSPAVAEALEHESLTTTYPTGAVLFAEGQSPRGVFIVRRGKVKLSICGSDGRTLILRMVEPGCLLGVAAVVSGCAYEATAETQEPSEISFLRHSDLLRLMRLHGELALVGHPADQRGLRLHLPRNPRLNSFRFCQRKTGASPGGLARSE